MKENLKSKKNIIIMAIVAIIIVIILIVAVATNNNKNKENNNNQNTNITVKSDYENLSVKDIKTDYNDETKETIFDCTIVNNADTKLEKEMINLVLINSKGETLDLIEMLVEAIDGKSTYNVSIILNGKVEDVQNVVIQKSQTIDEKVDESAE